MPETALVEILLASILLLLGVIGWGLRKWYRELSDTLDQFRGELQRNRQEIDRHQVSIFGKENTPWDGYNEEITTSRTAIRKHRDVLETHEELLEKHAKALEREDILEAEDSDDIRIDDLPELPSLGPHRGGMGP